MEIFDPKTAYAESERPLVTELTGIVTNRSYTLNLTGSGLRGRIFQEAAGGSTNSSATSQSDPPMIYLPIVRL